MKKYLVDTNIFLDFFLDRDKKRGNQIEAFFNRSDKLGNKLCTSILALAETFWVLKSFYKKDKLEIIEIIDKIVGINNLSIVDYPDELTLKNTLTLFKTHNISFIDAYFSAICLDKQADFVVSFDKDFDKISLIKRQGP